MRRSALTAFCLLALLQMAALPAMAEKRVAFVIGNARYEKLDALRNPKRDAAVIADRLKDLGFEVFELFDADAFGMGRAADGFLRAARGADLALFYFAGHGVQLFDRNFLLARDVDPFAATTPAELGIDLADFMDKLRHAGPIRQALLIDACRDNPLTFDTTVSLMQRLQGPAAAPTAQLARSVRAGRSRQCRAAAAGHRRRDAGVLRGPARQRVIRWQRAEFVLRRGTEGGIRRSDTAPDGDLSQRKRLCPNGDQRQSGAAGRERLDQRRSTGGTGRRRRSPTTSIPATTNGP